MSTSTTTVLTICPHGVDQTQSVCLICDKEWGQQARPNLGELAADWPLTSIEVIRISLAMAVVDRVITEGEANKALRAALRGGVR